MADYAAMNEVYGSFFSPGLYPARAAYQVAALPLGAKVEIEAVAVVGPLVDVDWNILIISIKILFISYFILI